MESRPPHCAACDREMAPGYVPGPPGFGVLEPALAAGWIAGDLKQASVAGVQAPWEQRWPIVAYRCPSCGLLQLYAQPRTWNT